LRANLSLSADKSDRDLTISLARNTQRSLSGARDNDCVFPSSGLPGVSLLIAANGARREFNARFRPYFIIPSRLYDTGVDAAADNRRCPNRGAERSGAGSAALRAPDRLTYAHGPIIQTSAIRLSSKVPLRVARRRPSRKTHGKTPTSRWQTRRRGTPPWWAVIHADARFQRAKHLRRETLTASLREGQ